MDSSDEKTRSDGPAVRPGIKTPTGLITPPGFLFWYARVDESEKPKWAIYRQSPLLLVTETGMEEIARETTKKLNHHYSRYTLAYLTPSQKRLLRDWLLQHPPT